jgi:hydroxymethylpyrimidine pyrophosphatase-like HAD family hydrolase
MAIGDNLNDLEMLDYARHAVVMGNASEEIRSLAQRRGWQVTASNDEDGVAVAIEELLRRQSPEQDADGNGEEAITASGVVQFAQ